MKKLCLILLLAGCVSAGRVSAQSASQDTATRNFIMHASIANLQEVVSGKLAAQKAADPWVKAFGTRMITDHQKAQDQLMQLVKAGGHQLPPEATGKVVPDAMLQKANGQSFDQLYVHMMVPGHRSTVALFQRYALNGKDPALKTFAQQTLPILKQHLEAITALDEKMKGQHAK